MVSPACAYILVEAEGGQTGTILAALRSVAGVVRAEAITGPYDIIITVEAADQRAIGQLVMEQIHQLAGIKRTITCLTIDA
jgi:DNA-binding Lrp family transcriptional regulator